MHVTFQSEQAFVELVACLPTVAARKTVEGLMGCLYVEAGLRCCLDCCSPVHLQVTPKLRFEVLWCTGFFLSRNHPAESVTLSKFQK